MKNKQYGKVVDFSEVGYIYIVSNEKEQDEFKIGYTKKSPYDRVKELSSATGVKKPFEMCWFKLVENAPLAEELIHRHLFRYRTNKDREFFKVPLEKAISVAEIVSETIQERAFSNTPNSYRNNSQEDNILLSKNNYSNPRYVELIKFLKENEGKKLFTDRELAKELKISVEGVNKLLSKLQDEKSKMLHISEDGRYGMYVGFKGPQLEAFSEEYPELDVSSLFPLFESSKKEQKKQFNNNHKSDKPVKQTFIYSNPKYLDSIKIFKILENKELSVKFLSEQINVSEKGAESIISRLLKEKKPVIIQNEETGNYYLNSEYTIDDWKDLDSKYPKLDISETVQAVINAKEKKQTRSRPRP